MSTLGQIQKFQLHQDLKDEIDNKATLDQVRDLIEEYGGSSSGGGSIAVDTYTKPEIDVKLDDKVDKISGKGLSSNDFTDTYKDKLDNLADSNSIEDITDSDITDLINSLDI